MEDIERSCENCKYENEDMAGAHCRNCVHNASDNFEPKEMCEWKLEDEETDLYITECNQRKQEFDGTLEEYDYKFCPYCGKKIKVVDNDK